MTVLFSSLLCFIIETQINLHLELNVIGTCILDVQFNTQGVLGTEVGEHFLILRAIYRIHTSKINTFIEHFKLVS